MEHRPVMLEEALEYLSIRPDGHYVDATFGRGGHSAAILEALGPKGTLLSIDKDPDAQAVAESFAKGDQRFSFHRGSFAHLRSIVTSRSQNQSVDGVLMDLGVSSPQLDNPERGFSFMRSGPLDMRMDPSKGESAADWLSHASEKDIAYVLKTYGEERFAKRIAKAIVEYREEAAIDSTDTLVSIIESSIPRRDPAKHPATRTFQAIRIYINQELEDIEQGLEGALEILNKGGRLVVISFHSLEDRIVKRFFNKHVKGDEHPAKLPIQTSALSKRFVNVAKKVRASQQETMTNPRARSAVLRAVEKIA